MNFSHGDPSEIFNMFFGGDGGGPESKYLINVSVF
jgi:hypothetical protein